LRLEHDEIMPRPNSFGLENGWLYPGEGRNKKMKSFIVSGYGRKVGSGRRDAFCCEIIAKDSNDAQLRIYEKYEHITGLRVRENRSL
jgi:hypothetical protein